jgi:hypothetical protein
MGGDSATTEDGCPELIARSTFDLASIRKHRLTELTLPVCDHLQFLDSLFDWEDWWLFEVKGRISSYNPTRVFLSLVRWPLPWKSVRDSVARSQRFRWEAVWPGQTSPYGSWGSGWGLSVTLGPHKKIFLLWWKSNLT